MDGFRFSMFGRQPCLNLYFPSWTLDTRLKFVAALFLVFGLSFAAEATSKFRHNLSKRPIGRDYQARRTRQMIISGLHGFQALLGYVVMLATMTFSVEILLSVVLGLSAGYFYFFAGEVGLEGHVTTNPCCNFMQDESDEREQRQQQQQQQEVSASVAQSQDSMTIGLLVASGEPQPECGDTTTV
jgi:Ctr copper transporter family